MNVYDVRENVDEHQENMNKNNVKKVSVELHHLFIIYTNFTT